MAREGVDLFVPTYVARGCLDESRTRLDTAACWIESIRSASPPRCSST
jgi:hypothetical protein